MIMNLKVWKADTLHALRVAQSSIKPDKEKVMRLQRILNNIDFHEKENRTEIILNPTLATFLSENLF